MSAATLVAHPTGGRRKQIRDFSVAKHRLPSERTERGIGAPRVSELGGVGACPPHKERSLTTEYSANGSFFRPQTHAVFHGTVADQLIMQTVGERQFRVSYGQATKGVR